jgi:hypothetical protein
MTDMPVLTDEEIAARLTRPAASESEAHAFWGAQLQGTEGCSGPVSYIQTYGRKTAS